MRELPKLWTGVARIQYLCAFLESIGVDSLHSVPLITSGFQSLLTTDLFRDQAQALFNHRMMGLDYPSEAAIRRQVALYNEAVNDPRSNIEAGFEIHPETLKFSKPANLIDTQVAQALVILRQALPYKKHGKVLIAPKNNSLVPIEIDREAQHVEIHSPPFEELEHHNLNRNITNDIEIPIAELIETAIDMDRMDQNDPEKRDNNWQKRYISKTLSISSDYPVQEKRHY